MGGMLQIQKRSGRRGSRRNAEINITNLMDVMMVLLVVFMAANITVSSLALYRSSTRAQGQPAQSGIEIWLDAHYSDDVMARIYPNAISVNQS